MNHLSLRLGVALLALFALAGCGSPGVPLPPSLELARPVSDLRAVRKGNTVYLTWSAPEMTTDRHNIQHPGPTEICRAVGTAMHQCGVAVGQVPFAKPPAPAKSAAKPQRSYSDQLPANLLAANPNSNLVYAVSVLNSYGRSAGLSNPVQVPAAPTLPPPDDFQAHLAADGVRLTWKAVTPAKDIPSVKYLYRVYRREAGTGPSSIAGEVGLNDVTPPSLLDGGFTWEKTYDYRLAVVTIVTPANGAEQQVEGDDTPSVTVVAHDVFPPAIPAGLQAV
jgi:predicted small lipoprotein YifL